MHVYSDWLDPKLWDKYKPDITCGETFMPPTKPEVLRDWEVVQVNEGNDTTERLRIMGGWLYRTTVIEVGVALVFVPAALGE